MSLDTADYSRAVRSRPAVENCIDLHFLKSTLRSCLPHKSYEYVRNNIAKICYKARENLII